MPYPQERNLSSYLNLVLLSEKPRCFASLNMTDQLWHGRSRICVAGL